MRILLILLAIPVWAVFVSRILEYVYERKDND